MNATQGFAYLAAAYIGACIFYLIGTQCYGSPFNDTLTPHQKRIKKLSAQKRGGAFLGGLVLSALILAIWQPFRAA